MDDDSGDLELPPYLDSGTPLRNPWMMPDTEANGAADPPTPSVFHAVPRQHASFEEALQDDTDDAVNDGARKDVDSYGPTRQPTWLQAVRWVVLVPAAFLGARLLFWLADIVIEVSKADAPLFLLFGDLLLAAAWGAGVVWLAFQVAPRFKSVVAGITAGLVSGAALLGVLLVLGSSNGSGFTLLKDLSVLLSSVCAAIWVAVLAYQDELERVIDYWLEDLFGFRH